MHWIALQPLPEPARSEADAGQAAQGTQAASVGDGLPVLADADALTALGWWALQFTPRVTLLAEAVLMEVQSSERLFGGQQMLAQRIVHEARIAA